MNKKTKNISVIIPAFNESDGIKRTIQNLIPLVKENGGEIIVIDDGSTDNTSEVLKEFNNIRVIKHPYNKGYGAALKTGIKAALNNILVFFDADGQHNHDDIVSLLNAFNGFDMMIGERGKDSYQDWIRKPGKWLLSKIANYLTGMKIPDLNSGLRITYKNIIIKLLHLFPDGFSFSTTSTIAFYNMGYNVGYIRIRVNKRTGVSTVKQIKHGSNTILLILRLIVLFNPLKVFIPVSIVLFIIGTIYEIIFGILKTPFGIKLIPGAFFLILTSILIFFFGLVVDQISEMRKQLNIK